MSPEPPEERLPGEDQVSRAYRAAGFEDEPPASIDRAIIEASRRSPRHPLASFMPPLALAATIVLSVSLVMQSGLLDNSSEVFPDGRQSSSPLPPPSAPLRLESPEVIENLIAPPTDLTLERDVERREIPLPAPPQLNEQRALQTLSVDEAEFASESLPTQRNDLQTLPTSVGEAFEQPAPCLSSDRALADTWLACISEILQQGGTEDAQRELETFIATYPDREVPAPLETLLPP